MSASILLAARDTNQLLGVQHGMVLDNPKCWHWDGSCTIQYMPLPGHYTEVLVDGGGGGGGGIMW